MILKHIALAALVLSAAAGPAAAQLTLVRDGEPAARIMPADPDETTALAAEELNLYLGRMSGATLPVVAEPSADGSLVVLGAPDRAWAAQAELASLAFDGFVVECAGDRLVLAGNVPEGTLNAVYWLLEELGVRWFIPTELGENVPDLPTVSIPAMNRRVEPRFVNRRNHGIDASILGEGEAWRRRVRITSHDLNVPFNRYSHNLYTIFPASVYGETHPEYFPLINGVRRIPETDHAQNWQPCTSNPEVVRLTIEAGRRWFAEHPEANFFSVGMNDSGEFCQCDRCTALDIPGATFRGRPMLSDRYFTFVRQVAEGIAETHPDRYVSCIAYSKVEAPPVNVELPDNVLVVITQDVGQWHDPAYRRADQEFARAWAGAAGAFGTYDYTGLTWTMPRVYPHLMADSLRFYDEIGAVAVTNEAFPTWWYAGPQMYLRAKLMWDPRQDADAVLGEFYDGFFGPASAPMERFYDRLEAVMMTERPGRWFEGLSSVIQQLDLWQPADLEACREALGEAWRLVRDTEPYAARVNFVSRGFRLADAMLEEYWLARRVHALGGSATVPADELAGVLGEFLDAAARRERVWEAIRDDELLSGIYTRILGPRPQRLASWRTYLQSAPAQAFAALIAHGDEVGASAIEDLVARAPQGLGFTVRAMHWATTHPDAPNACVNPGFEEAGDGEAPAGLDWVATNTPPGWSKWEIDGAYEGLTWEAEGGRSGPRCVRISGARDGCFIQPIPVTPGERWFVSIWARSTGSREQSPRLLVRWRDAEGAWTANEAGLHVDGEGGADRWQQLMVVATVPDGAGQAVLLPAATGQGPGDVVIFDDARAVRLPDEPGEPEG